MNEQAGMFPGLTARVVSKSVLRIVAALALHLYTAAVALAAPAREHEHHPRAETSQLTTRIEALRHTLLPGLAGPKWTQLERLLATARKADADGTAEAGQAAHAWSRVRLFLRSIEAEHPLRTKVNGNIQLGEITLHRDEHCLSIPVRYCPNPEMPIEVICCRKDAPRAYETLFTTSARPLHFQTMLILLGATNGSRSTQDDPKQARGDLFDLQIRISGKDGKIQRYPLEAFLDDGREAALTRLGWVFTGSTVRDGRFSADQNGELILSWAVNAAVLVAASAEIADGKRALQYKPDAPLPLGTDATLYIIPRERKRPPPAAPEGKW